MPVKCMHTNANSSDNGIVHRGQQRRPHAPQKQEQHRDYNQQTFQQRVRDRVQRVVHQVGAVIYRDHPNAFGAAGPRLNPPPLP